MYHVSENPLECGCDVSWIITNPIWRDLVTDGTICANGTYFNQLDPKYYEEQC